jgi:hypothetical protein
MQDFKFTGLWPQTLGNPLVTFDYWAGRDANRRALAVLGYVPAGHHRWARRCAARRTATPTT